MGEVGMEGEPQQAALVVVGIQRRDLAGDVEEWPVQQVSGPVHAPDHSDLIDDEPAAVLAWGLYEL